MLPKRLLSSWGEKWVWKTKVGMEEGRLCKHGIPREGNDTARSPHREDQEIRLPPPASARATGRPWTAPLLPWSSGLCTHPVRPAPHPSLPSPQPGGALAAHFS